MKRKCKSSFLPSHFLGFKWIVSIVWGTEQLLCIPSSPRYGIGRSPKAGLSPRQIITRICHQVESGAHLPPGGCGRSKGGNIVTSGQVSRSLLLVFLASQETNKMTGTWRNTTKLSRHTPQRISHLEFCNFSKYSIREMFKVKVLLWFECCIKMKRLFQSRFRFENVKVKHLNVLIYVFGQELTFCIKFNKIIRLKIVNFGSGNCFEIFMSLSGQLVWNKVGKLSSKMTYK